VCQPFISIISKNFNFITLDFFGTRHYNKKQEGKPLWSGGCSLIWGTETADLNDGRFLLYLPLLLNRVITPIMTSAKTNKSLYVT
jgi:hypothetical protein